MPSGVEMRAMIIEAVVQAHPVTDVMLDRLRVPEPFRTELRDAWDKFRGPVDDTAEFELGRELHYSRNGFVDVFVRYDGETHLGFRTYDEAEELDLEHGLPLERVLDLDFHGLEHSHVHGLQLAGLDAFERLRDLGLVLTPRHGPRRLSGEDHVLVLPPVDLGLGTAFTARCPAGLHNRRAYRRRRGGSLHCQGAAVVVVL
jgi:hypothetical protein